jgi:hypothetical protein
LGKDLELPNCSRTYSQGRRAKRGGSTGKGWRVYTYGCIPACAHSSLQSAFSRGEGNLCPAGKDLELRIVATGIANFVCIIKLLSQYIFINLRLDRTAEKDLHKVVNQFINDVHRKMGVRLFVLTSYMNESDEAICSKCVNPSGYPGVC